MTRGVVAVAALAAVLVGSVRPAAAQAAPRRERIWFGVSGGVQAADNRFDDGFDLVLNAETGKVAIAYPVTRGAIVAAAGGVRVWKRLAIGLGVTRYNRRTQATVKARLPHPFFDNQFRDVEGAAPVTRRELGAHLLIGWMMPLSDRLSVTFSAGPSVLNVTQTFVTGVEFSETYPYDSATFTRGATADASSRAAGFNAGADVCWMFSRHAGAGGLVQMSRARATGEAAPGRTIRIDAGGAHIAAGLRVVF